MALLSLHSGRRYFIAFFLAACLGVGLFLAFRWMLADMNHYSAIAVMDQWEANGEVGSLQEWEAVRGALDYSVALDAGEPDYYRLQALSDDWRGFAIAGEEVSAQDLMAARRSALDAYREMVARRPADPAGWAHVARMKVMVGERDDEFRRALGNALVLGKNKPQILEEVAYTVSLSWASVREDEVLKALVVESLARGLERRQFGEILGYLEGTSAIYEVCMEVDLEDVARRVHDACAVE